MVHEIMFMFIECLPIGKVDYNCEKSGNPNLVFVCAGVGQSLAPRVFRITAYPCVHTDMPQKVLYLRLLSRNRMWINICMRKIECEGLKWGRGKREVESKKSLDMHGRELKPVMSQMIL